MSDSTRSWQELYNRSSKEIGSLPSPGVRIDKTAERRRVVLSSIAVEAGRLQVSEGFDSSLPGIVFSRPATVPADDSALVWHLNGAARSGGARASREIAADFWRWHESIAKVEADDAGKVLCVLRGATQCADAESYEDATMHILFLWRHYGHVIGATLAPKEPMSGDLPRELGAGRDAFNRLVYQMTRRVETLPTWLLYFGYGPIPSSVRARPPKDTHAAKSYHDTDGDDDF